MERRWNGPAQVKALGDDPTKAQINQLFAIPGATKTDSALPHHTVTGGKVGAADIDGCTAAIADLNGAQGGVNATKAEKDRAYSHLASHIRAAGQTPPEKKFAAARAAVTAAAGHAAGARAARAGVRRLWRGDARQG
jgi:hypothetical protein